MPDIAMCENKECPLKLDCYRFMAKPASYQYYALFEPVGKECEGFIQVRKKITETEFY